MKISIQPLSIENQTGFFSLFDDETFAHEKEWKKCYCISYHTTCSGEEWDLRTDDENLNEAVQKIRNGEMHGLLAFDGDHCVGWLNVNDARSYVRITEELEDKFLDGKTAIAICFVIRSNYRGKHIASALLEHAISYCKNLGYDRLISLKYENPSHVHNFSGPVKMYLDRGFKEYQDMNGTEYLSIDL